MCKVAASPTATVSKSSGGSPAQASEVWLWDKGCAGTSLVRNAKRKQLPVGTVHSIHPVGTPSTFQDPGPEETERLRGIAANSLAKLSGFAVSEPSTTTAVGNASASSNVTANATFAVVFADGSVAHVTLATGQPIPNVVRVSPPETDGNPAVLAAAHCPQSFVTVAAAPPSTSGASVSLFTSQVHASVRPLAVDTQLAHLEACALITVFAAESLSSSSVSNRQYCNACSLYPPNWPIVTFSGQAASVAISAYPKCRALMSVLQSESLLDDAA